VGKSTYIRSEIEEEKKREYIYFPLGGVFTRKEVLERLKELINLKNLNNATLHLDLNDTDQIDLTMEFLFSILITKIYGQNDDIFYLPNDVEIMVEIPNGFVDFMKKFPILDIFKKTTLELEKLRPLIVKPVLDTNVQIVANYLNLLETDKNGLNTRDVYFEGINPFFRNSDTKIVAKIFPQKECQRLIFERIKRKIPKPNYYQITSFINVLGTQLRKFSQNILLSAMSLNDKDTRIKEYKPLEGIRSFVIENFIEFTTYFTEGGFIDLINNQMKNYRQTIRNFDEDKDNEEAIKQLADVDETKNMTSFNKMKRTLLLFAEGNGESMSIISNLQDKN
jgi:hypothetical protein